MRYFARIKKPSPINSLWRKNNLAKANLQGTLFTLNKAAGFYEAVGEIPLIGALMKNPHVEVSAISELVGEVAVVQPTDEDLTTPVQENPDAENPISSDN